MITTSLLIQLVLLIIPPAILGYLLNRRLGVSWFLFMGGALAFAVAWIVTSFVPPQLNLLFSSIVQMGVLYLTYRFLLNSVTTEREAVMVGAGHGGIELMLIGIFALLSFLQVSQLRNAPDETLAELVTDIDDIAVDDVQPSRIDEMRESIDEFWNSPWYGPVIQPIQTFVQALPLRNTDDEKIRQVIAEANDLAEDEVQPERITDLRHLIASFWNTPGYAPFVQPFQALFTLPIQIALAVIVLGTVIHNRWRTLVTAMALHLLSRVLPLYGQLLGGVLAWLGLSILFGIVAIWFLNGRWSTIQTQADIAFETKRSAKRKKLAE